MDLACRENEGLAVDVAIIIKGCVPATESEAQSVAEHDVSGQFDERRTSGVRDSVVGE
jgi:hypothetical protein